MWMLLLALLYMVGCVNAENNSVNVWVAILPITGIGLVALFTVFCVCRFACRFISCCTKAYEKHRSTAGDKVVTIPMPTHSHINEVLMVATLNKRKKRRNLPTAPILNDEQEGNVPTEGDMLLRTDSTGNRLSESEGTTMTPNNQKPSSLEQHNLNDSTIEKLASKEKECSLYSLVSDDIITAANATAACDKGEDCSLKPQSITDLETGIASSDITQTLTTNESTTPIDHSLSHIVSIATP